MSRHTHITLLAISGGIILLVGCSRTPPTDVVEPPPTDVVEPPTVTAKPEQPPWPMSISTNRYLIYWPVEGGEYSACLETNSYTIKDGRITFRVDGIREIIRWERIGMNVTLTPPWAITDTLMAVEKVPAEVPQ